MVQACAAAGVVLIPQGANTGLTGGSVPRVGGGSHRPSVVVSTRRLQSTRLVDGSSLVLCQAGAGIVDASIAASSVGREGHSVLGSIFLNPTASAGVAFGSGGTQLRKGPAYTERLLWLAVDEHGKVQVHNTLGLKTSSGDDVGVRELDAGVPIQNCSVAARASLSDVYRGHVCSLDEHVSRYNADCSGPDPNRCEGKVRVPLSPDATCLDT